MLVNNKRKMRRYYIIFAILIFISVISYFTVYWRYRSELIFAPDIFLTELIKFVILTSIGMFIADFLGKVNNNRKKEKDIEVLFTANLKELKAKLETNIDKGELTYYFDILLHHSRVFKHLHELDSFEQNALTQFEINISSETFRETIKDLEFLIEKNEDYSKSNSILKIQEQLKKLSDVFGNKKQK